MNGYNNKMTRHPFLKKSTAVPLFHLSNPVLKLTSLNLLTLVPILHSF